MGLLLFPSWGKEWWLKKLVLTILGVTVLAPFNADLASNLAFSPGLRALMSLNSHYPTGLLSRLVFKQATKLLEVSPPSQLFQPGNNAERLFCLCSILHRGKTTCVPTCFFKTVKTSSSPAVLS